MSAPDGLDRRLAAWMTDTASGPPPAGPFEEAMEATARRRPRPRWLASIGSDWAGAAPAGRPERLSSGVRRGLGAAIAAALLVAGVVGIQVLGGASVGDPGVVPATPVPSSTPVLLPTAGALAPGTYFLGNPATYGDPPLGCDGGCSDYQRIIFTLPAGWATRDELVYKHLGEPGEVAFSAWTVDQVYADPCHWQGSALGPLDLKTAQLEGTSIVVAPADGGLTNQAGRNASSLTLVTFGGWPAMRIDLSVPADLDISACDQDEYRSWTEWHVPDGANSHNAPGQLDAVYMVDVDRRALVIDASHMPGTSGADLAELDATLASMVVDRGPGWDAPSPSGG